ncbi:MAG: wax ester/triacylglycerol synthase family O-acyltransferase [Myxococcota bacterium]
MASYRYELLSPQDAAFLAAEGPTTPMHIGAAFVAEAGPLETPDGGIDIARVRAFIGSRLHRIPRYRQRVAYTPLRKRPLWIDDRHFKVEYHVRHTALPRPGDAAQLKRLIGRVCAQPLDRGHPLWELWVVEGLQGGRRFALISKVHHCMVDGVSSTELLTLLMSARPNDEPEAAPPFVPRPAPGARELARDELLGIAQAPLEVASQIRGLFAPERRAELGEALRAAGQLAARALLPASHTPLNREIGPHRRFDYFGLDLALVKAIKDKLGGTLNDVVLAAVAGAMRRFLQRRLVDVGSLDFRISAPVSVRSTSERGVLGNRVSAWIIRAPVGEPDPLRRLDAIRVATRRLKESNQALGADLLSAVTEWTGTTLLSLGTAFQNLGRPQNLIVTNVPGPQLRLYLVGAPLFEAYPIAPLFQNQAVIIALFSYDGRLFFGLNADSDGMPDLADLCADLRGAFDELAALAAV